MAKTDFKSVDEYLASQPEATRAALHRVRGAIRSALPKADEVISYQIPTYKLAGGAVIFFAGWKKHFSLYPASDLIIETFKEELEPYEVNKGTIRFPLDQPVPLRLIAGIAKLRAKEMAERVKAKSPAPKKQVRQSKASIRK